MKIDSRVEPLVRNTIYTAVIGSFSELEKALQSFSDDETAQKAIELGVSLIYVLMIDIYEGMPSDEEIQALAAEVARAEDWAQPTEEGVTVFLRRLMKGEPFAGVVPVEDIVILTFVVAAHLLSSCRRDDEEWWDYLDRVEAALEASG